MAGTQADHPEHPVVSEMVPQPGTPSSTGISQRLWLDSQQEVQRSLFHPFVLGIARGDLPRAAFQHYIGQDAYFLEVFARAYALAAAQSHSLPDKVTNSLIGYMKGVFEELALHKSYAKENGVDLEKCSPSAATTAYCDFVMSVASSQRGVAAILSAMAPCMRLYAFLGAQLAAKVPFATSPDNPYSEWVKTYSSPEFQELASGLEATLDELAEEAAYGSLRDDYRTAMALETAFFSAQPELPAGCRRPVRLLVTDFDDTITTADTTPVIIEEAFRAAEAAAATPEDGKAVRQDRQARLDEVLQLISAEKAKLMESIMPPKGATPEGYNVAQLESAAAALSDFDRRMNDAAFSSGIIQGLMPDAVMEAGKSVGLQEGALSTLEKAASSGVPVHVVSVSWEGNIIRGALGMPAEAVKIHANSLQLNNAEGAAADEGCAGGTTQEIQCADDKRSVLGKLLKGSATRADEGLSVFIGDSATDLLALLQADVGIVIGKNATLRAFAAAAGVSIKPLLMAASETANLPEGTLYQAESWWEVKAFLFGPGATNNTIAAAAAVSTTPVPTGRAPMFCTPQVPRALTIAGSDSGGGAGIQADLKTFMAQGTFGMSAITALTAQNTQGVQGVLPIDPDFVAQQLDSVIGDIGVDAIKTGMLPNPEIIGAVADAIRKHKVKHVVVDPVLISTSGASLASSAAAKAMVKELLPLATVVTPNLAEVSALLGGRHVETLADMKDAAKELHALGPKMVLVKGGHLEGEPEAVDVLFDGAEIHEIRARFVLTENLHGTGCTLAAAIAAELAKGHSPIEAIRNAKFFLTEALGSSADLTIGTGMQKPFNHAYRIADWTCSPKNAPSVDYRLYAVTDPVCNEKAGRGMVEAVKAAIQGGATIVQLREKDTDGGDFCALARDVLEVARPAGVPVLINDRLDVVLASGADGAHVGQSDISMRDARRILGPDAIIGVSVATVEQALKAQSDGADYVGAGAVYPTTTKGDANNLGEGMKTLEAICSAVDIPVVGIGGIGAENAVPVIHSGAAGVAVVSSIFAAKDVQSATEDIIRVVDGALTSD